METVTSKKNYYSTVKIIALTIVALIFLEIFVIGVAIVSGDSMYPTLNHRDRLIYTKISHFINNPKRGDIIIFTPSNKNSTYDLFIKRVVAIEGDVYFIDDGVLYINGIAISEDYICNEIYEDKYYPHISGKVPSDKVFVLGDNRNNSKDSRRFCCINVEQITGKVLSRIWPLKDSKIFSAPYD